ncbi:MAG: electron transfer flavoprotein subunit alpha/FixB family protein [Ignavibacteriales bacterium]|nr:electron transfer flavoprotein subunit alpha/FixB family protein [Ignavibacteriales bacterium]
MANKLLIVLEQRDNKIKKASIEALKVGADIANKLNAESLAVCIGDDVVGLNDLSGYGVKKVFHYKNKELLNYSPSAYKKILLDFIGSQSIEYIFVSATALGKDLAPRLAGNLKCGIAMDCVAFDVQNSEVIATRPVYAGKALIDVKLNSEKKVFTIRPNVFAIEKVNSDSVEVEVIEVSDIDLSTKTIEVKKVEDKIDVAEADIIVSGGRGLKGVENFKMLEDLAKQLNAAVGASRAVVDAGWRPHSDQVGQTGKTVSPNLYIAVAISGAIQHIAGMRSSKYIVAINKDKDAPIFQIADYGIVADAFEIVPALTLELKK